MRIALAVVAACLALGGCSHGYQAYRAEPRRHPHLQRHLHRHPTKALKTLSARTSKPVHAGQANNGDTYSQEGQHRMPSGNSSPSESSSPSETSSPTETSNPSGTSGTDETSSKSGSSATSGSSTGSSNAHGTSSPNGSSSPSGSSNTHGTSSPSGSSNPSGSSSPTGSSNTHGSSGSSSTSGSSNPSGSSSPNADNPSSTTRYYVVLDPIDNCAVIDAKPSTVSVINTLGDKSGYVSLAAANKALSHVKAKCKRVIE
jgi:hypothetical protein